MTVTEISACGHSEQVLQLPDLPEDSLEIVLVESEDSKIEEITENYPLAISDVTTQSILGFEQLTNGEDVKEVYSFKISNNYKSFKPGDTIGIVTQNRNTDIDNLFNHLGISNMAEKKCKIIEKIPSKTSPLKPNFLGKVTTLKYIFTFCLDVCCLPKKLLIRVLLEYTKDPEEKRYLQELCSKEKSNMYTKEILESNVTFLDFILKFSSCRPPAARLVEHLPKLMPRPYSIASSPLSTPESIRIVFSVIKQSNKEGLCTGMLKDLIKSENNERKVKMFFRKCNGFNLPEDDVPLILVGPGTGIAPFIGFLEHRKMENRKGKIWLFFGCRHKEKDFLFEKELEDYLKIGVLSKLSVSFSRDDTSDAKYVQDNILKHASEICQLIFDENAMIYVCGDVKNMRKDVQNTFVKLFEDVRGMTNKEATEYMKKLQKEKRYLQDIWL